MITFEPVNHFATCSNCKDFGRNIYKIEFRQKRLKNDQEISIYLCPNCLQKINEGFFKIISKEKKGITIMPVSELSDIEKKYVNNEDFYENLWIAYR